MPLARPAELPYNISGNTSLLHETSNIASQSLHTFLKSKQNCFSNNYGENKRERRKCLKKNAVLVFLQKLHEENFGIHILQEVNSLELRQNTIL